MILIIKYLLFKTIYDSFVIFYIFFLFIICLNKIWVIQVLIEGQQLMSLNKINRRRHILRLLANRELDKERS